MYKNIGLLGAVFKTNGYYPHGRAGLKIAEEVSPGIGKHLLSGAGKMLSLLIFGLTSSTNGQIEGGCEIS